MDFLSPNFTPRVSETVQDPATVTKSAPRGQKWAFFSRSFFFFIPRFSRVIVARQTIHFVARTPLLCGGETYRAHQGVEHADSEGGAAGEGLGEVQLRVRVVVVVLVQELNVGVVDWQRRGRG